jgi:hypothetical protein
MPCAGWGARRFMAARVPRDLPDLARAIDAEPEDVLEAM